MKQQCLVCDNEYEVFNSNKDRVKTCSTECGMILRKINQVKSKKQKVGKDVDGKYSYLFEGRTKLYDVWKNMKYRCHNKNSPGYKKYGARGIIVCEQWRDDYISFGKWMIDNGYVEREGKLSSKTPSIDRIDPGSNYSPDNCRVISHGENSKLAEIVSRKVHVYKIDGSYVSSFGSLTDASKRLNVRIEHMSEALDPLSSRKQIGGYRFSDVLLDKLPVDMKIRNTSPIEAFNSSGKSVGVFKQKKDACIALGISGPTNISAVLNGRRKHAKGFTFKYVQ